MTCEALDCGTAPYKIQSSRNQ